MIHRVFLSSTFSDLRDYRQTVQGAIRQLGAIDVSMEHFGARDERPADECRRLVRDESDLFVGIYAHKYGYIPDGSDISIAEMEYKAASVVSMPRFNYLVDETQPWLPAHIDTGANRDRLVAFKKGLLKRHICKQFASRDQLKWSPMWVVTLPCNPLPREVQESRPMPLPSALTEMIQKLKRSG